MARADISYDFEDFGMDAAQLQGKYGSLRSHHPEYTTVKWHAAPDHGDFNGYWDWVASQIAKDDDELPGNDAQGNPIPDDLIDVQSVDQFAAMVSHWHSNRVARLKSLLAIPEGSEATLTEGGQEQTVVLAGDALLGYRLAITTALAEIEQLPFLVSVEDAPEPAANDDAAPGN